MSSINLPKPISAGILLSYSCTGQCRHCMYACSPDWRSDWISLDRMMGCLTWLAPTIAPSPRGRESVSVNHGLHFTGGEPFLRFSLLLESVEFARKLSIPSVFVETNCYWCTSDKVTRDRMVELKKAGLCGILLSVNPFILEYVPFDRTERGVRVGAGVFGNDALVYQSVFYNQFRALGIRGMLSFEEYLEKTGLRGLTFAEVLTMGRFPYSLGYLFRRYRASEFLMESCRNELTRNWHIHIDNYGNYMPGFCGGISMARVTRLGDFGTQSLNKISGALTVRLEKLWQLGRKFGYSERQEGYISKCHLCVDIRRHLVSETDQFPELAPKEFYSHLECAQRPAETGDSAS